MQFGSTGTDEVLQQVGRDLLGDEEVATSAANANITHSFPGNTGAHKRA